MLRKYVVVPPMKGGLEDLREMAGNIWFSWNPDAVELFHHLDEHTWEETNHNPQQVLIRLSKTRFNEILNDEGYRAHAEKVYHRFRAYMARERAYDFHLPAPIGFSTAYFSLEFGLTECLPIYSGGLGLLAGDHLKSSSDLNLPLVAVGLMYREGYFNQKLSPGGWQEEVYVRRELDTLPLERLTNQDGQPVKISVDLAGEPLYARVVKVSVGRVPLYLLDCDIPENPPHLKDTTARLYGGDTENRIRQEILLGMGGCRALQAVGLEPAVYHLNEGHAAFALLERMRYFMEEKGLSLEQAREMVVSQSILTIHTPVPAGNDVFDRGLMQKYFSGLAAKLGMSLDNFMGLGRRNPMDSSEGFWMPVLGLRLTSRTNGVSNLHARVARDMWRHVWPKADIDDVPIVPITNGVHIPSYISRDMAKLYDRYLGPAWNEDPDNEEVWARAETIPDTELWRTHERCRAALIHFARKRLVRQLRGRGASAEEIDQARRVLSPEVLTICFARRFATYKRATLLFRDTARLKSILTHPDRPVQIIFAGKAHPADNQGKELIRTIIQIIRDKDFRPRVVFLEDYDINVARHMVQGADVWLNTPRRPMEACGTSGMKAAANGALNLSILDGWWDEGYFGDNGWAIGAGEEYVEPETQDIIESHALYDLLEESVPPPFYDTGVDELPREWIRMMKRSIGTVCPVFNSHRMVTDYVENCYLPAAANHFKLEQDNFRAARGLVSWKEKIRQRWNDVSVLDVTVQDQQTALKGKEMEVEAIIRTAGLNPDELRVELLHGPIDLWDNFKVRLITQLEPKTVLDQDGGRVAFAAMIPLMHSGLYGYEVRVTPEHPNLAFSDRLTYVKRG